MDEMTISQLMAAAAAIETRTMSRAEWYQWHHEARWWRREVRLACRRMSASLRPGIQRATAAFRQLSRVCEPAVQVYERGRLVETLREVRDRG